MWALSVARISEFLSQLDFGKYYVGIDNSNRVRLRRFCGTRARLVSYSLAVVVFVLWKTQEKRSDRDDGHGDNHALGIFSLVETLCCRLCCRIDA